MYKCAHSRSRACHFTIRLSTRIEMPPLVDSIAEKRSTVSPSAGRSVGRSVEPHAPHQIATIKHAQSSQTFFLKKRRKKNKNKKNKRGEMAAGQGLRKGRWKEKKKLQLDFQFISMKGTSRSSGFLFYWATFSGYFFR